MRRGVDVLFDITGMRTENDIVDNAFEALDHAMKCLKKREAACRVPTKVNFELVHFMLPLAEN